MLTAYDDHYEMIAVEKNFLHMLCLMHIIMIAVKMYDHELVLSLR